MKTWLSRKLLLAGDGWRSAYLDQFGDTFPTSRSEKDCTYGCVNAACQNEGGVCGYCYDWKTGKDGRHWVKCRYFEEHDNLRANQP